MILDSLTQADRYLHLHPLFGTAFEFLRRADLATLAPGRYDIVGDKLFALVSHDQGRSAADCPLESHRKRIDIQLSLSGGEQMGWKPTADCRQISHPYDEARDLEFYADAPSTWVLVEKMQFAIFFPADAHAPLRGNGPLAKVVLKVTI